jgi:hypothetical protein
MPPPHAMEALRPALAALRLAAPPRSPAAQRPLYQCLHTSATRRATPSPFPSVVGPPPSTPTPHPSAASERVARKKRQAALLSQAQDIRSSSAPSQKPKAMLKKRFWKDVTVRETEGGCLLYHARTHACILLTADSRPARLPRQPARPHADQGDSQCPPVQAPARPGHCPRVGPPPKRAAGAQDALHPHDVARRARPRH